MFFNIFPVIGEALPGHLECSPAACVLILQFTLKGKPNFLTTNELDGILAKYNNGFFKIQNFSSEI